MIKMFKIMHQYKSHALELPMEILYQVRSGNCDEDKLRKCTNLTLQELDRVLRPLISERLIKKVSISGENMHFVYILTDSGERFMDILGFAFSYPENEDDLI